MEISNNLYEEAYIPEPQWEVLKNLAIEENWNYKVDVAEHSYPILRNYLFHTFKRLVELHNLYPDKGYLICKDNSICFNSGLLTKKYEEIFVVLKRNRNEGKCPWYLVGFNKESDKQILKLGKLPRRAEYIANINDLVLNTDLELVSNLDHILEDEENLNRIPADLRNSPILLSCFKGSIDTLVKRLKANYKIAVPHFYNNKVQLLLPISLRGNNEADVVLTVERIKNFYRGCTCLTLDMAYNNARLIAKPEIDWLVR